MDHFFQNINGWSHYLEPWYKHIVPLLPDNPQVVEVGCWHGRSTACLAVELINCKDNFKLWAVDHWLGCTEHYYFINNVRTSLENDIPYQTFLENMNPVINRIDILRDTSVRAAEQFKDNSLDLVILDDEHIREGVLHSIMAWWPKVKVDGIICGDDHDHFYPGVIMAVRELFGNKEDSYQVFCHHGLDDRINEHGVWVVRKIADQQISDIQLPEDPWEFKIPYKTGPDLEPESEVIEEIVESQEEQITPISHLQNPKKHSII